MYRHLERRFKQQLSDFLRATYQLELPKIVIEQPPKVEFGEYASPLAFELAKKLRKAKPKAPTISDFHKDQIGSRNR